MSMTFLALGDTAIPKFPAEKKKQEFWATENSLELKT